MNLFFAQVVEYNLNETRFTEFSARLHNEELGLGQRWTSRLFPVTSIQFHPSKPNFILLSDDCGLYIINKDAVIILFIIF